MQTINLDFSVRSVIPVLRAKQGDVGRKFKAIVTDGGAAYPVPAGAAVSVWYSGASGEGNYTDIGADSAVSVSGNEITVELITQMLANYGEGKLCLAINTADGDQIGTWNIPYMVEPLPGMGSAAAQEYFTSFSKTVGDLRQAIEDVSGFDVDPTLTVSGAAADAAAVGTALEGKAPGGFGLGESTPPWTLSDCNKGVRNGWYRTANSAANAPLKSGCWLRADMFSALYGVQTLHSETYGGIAFQRYSVAESWQPWEYVNPPMISGVEYRTTERWNGKPVYTKLIDYGDVGAGYSSLSTGCGSRVIRAAVTHGSGVVPFDGVGAINNSYTTAFGIDNNTLHFLAGSEVGTANLSAQLWYIKD